jgi:hypothetical protein
MWRAASSTGVTPTALAPASRSPTSMAAPSRHSDRCRHPLQACRGRLHQPCCPADRSVASRCGRPLPPDPVQLAGQALYNATAISDLTTASPRYVINFSARWTLSKLAIKLEEQIYGKSSEWENDDGYNPSNTPEYFESNNGIASITNLDVSYRLARHFTLSAGKRLTCSTAIQTSATRRCSPIITASPTATLSGYSGIRCSRLLGSTSGTTT